MSTAASAASQDQSLQSDALGLLGTVSLTAAFMAPAASLIALFGPIISNVGASGGFVMLAGLLVTLPSAVSFGMLARELPSAGGVYTWARSALGVHAGRWVGLITISYFIVLLVFPPVVFGQMFVDLIGSVGAHMTPGLELAVWAIGAVISLLIAGFVTYRGVVGSSRLAFAMLLVQLVLMSALAVHFLVIAIAEGRLSWTPFLPSGSAGGWSGIFLALPLAMLSLVCDGAVPASEETRDAKRTIPLAIFLALMLVGTWDVLAFGAFGLAAPPEELVRLGSDPVINPMPVLAERVWGPFKVLITVIGIAAMIGALIPCATASSRMLYSLGRDGTLPAALTRVHPRYRTPWNALTVVFALTVLATFPIALRLGPTATINWWGIIVGWLILAVYFAANLSNIVYFTTVRRDRFNPLWNLIMPVTAMLIQIAVLWRIVIKEPWQAGTVGRSAQLFIVLVTLVMAGYVYWIRRHGRDARPTDSDPVASGALSS